MSGKSQKKGLGRGLSALMADVSEKPAPVELADDTGARSDILVPIEKIHPNPDQPRRTFDPDMLDDLAASLSEKGVIQPLIVRAHPTKTGEFEIVAGERRWRASQKAQLHEIPVLVRDFNDTEVLEVAIIENIQRADLNPVEEAQGYSQLMDKFGHTQEKLAEVLGKSRSYIANAVRLLGLPDEVHQLIADGKLSAGHARALITADDPILLARYIVGKSLSVRETEKLVKNGLPTPSNKTSAPAPANEKDADTKSLEGDLSANLKMKVSITHKPGFEKGSVTVSYTNLEQLDELCRLLSGNH